MDDTVVQELWELGVALYFKPLWLDDLVRIVKRLLGQRETKTGSLCTALDAGMTIGRPSDAPNRLSLLLVDDCDAERDLYRLALEREFNILTAGRGDEGIALAGHERPDVIVLDVQMPGGDGWLTCTHLKNDPRVADIPVIFLTGLDDHDLVPRARAVGAAALLRKPCPADRLHDAILDARGSAVRHRTHTVPPEANRGLMCVVT